MAPQGAGIGSEPEAAGRIESQRVDQVVAELGSVFHRKVVEGHAIEAGQALLGPAPEVTCRALQHRKRRRLGQALAVGPAVDTVLGDLSAGLEGWEDEEGADCCLGKAEERYARTNPSGPWTVLLQSSEF